MYSYQTILMGAACGHCAALKGGGAVEQCPSGSRAAEFRFLFGASRAQGSEREASLYRAGRRDELDLYAIPHWERLRIPQPRNRQA